MEGGAEEVEVADDGERRWGDDEFVGFAGLGYEEAEDEEEEGEGEKEEGDVGAIKGFFHC